jgi:hypothetical protein
VKLEVSPKRAKQLGDVSITGSGFQRWGPFVRVSLEYVGRVPKGAPPGAVPDSRIETFKATVAKDVEGMADGEIDYTIRAEMAGEVTVRIWDWAQTKVLATETLEVSGGR